MIFFSWYDDVCLFSHEIQYLGLDMIRSYCLLTVFILLFTGGAEHAAQSPSHENLADN
jgi:hypothetical protein